MAKQSVPFDVCGLQAFQEEQISTPDLRQSPMQWAGAKEGGQIFIFLLVCKGNSSECHPDIWAAEAAGMGRQNKQVIVVYRAGWTCLLFQGKC